jgi:hypothetical protein
VDGVPDDGRSLHTFPTGKKRVAGEQVNPVSITSEVSTNSGQAHEISRAGQPSRLECPATQGYRGNLASYVGERVRDTELVARGVVGEERRVPERVGHLSRCVEGWPQLGEQVILWTLMRCNGERGTSSS